MLPLEFKLDVRQPGDGRIGVALDLDRSALPGAADGVELFLPVWTPGSYLVREYARHLEQLAATDAETGAAVPWRKTAKNRYLLTPPAGCRRLRVSYRVYGHELTVRTADFTEHHAFWNGACVCLWPVGGEDLAAGLEVSLPAGWELVTQLRRAAGPGVRLEAADLHEVVDAPCLAGALELRELEVLGVPHTLALDGLEGVSIPDTLLEDTRRVIEEAAAIFGGELPYDRYRFLALLTDEGRGGLEHTHSSVLLAPRTTFAPRKSYQSFLALVAHEFFHVWNGKRMRPAALWSFDYERENYTTLLWVAEGFTSYYDDHLCLRAGILDREAYLQLLAERVGAMHRTPGRLVHPLSAASFDAWIKLYRPDENSRNSTQSYYAHGAIAALCLDLRIRAATGGRRSLDDAVAELFRTTFGEGRGYGEDDVVACLSRAAGEDLGSLVAELVHGPFEPELDRYLEPFGLRTASTPGERPELGIQLASAELRLASVLRGSPAMAAGLAPGDELLALDGLRVSRAIWPDVLQNIWRPGATLRVLLARRGVILEREIAPAPAEHDTWRIEEIPDAGEAAARLRDAWLGQDA